MKKILLCNKFFYLNGGCERVFFQERDFLLDRGLEVLDFSMADSRNFPSPYSGYFVANVDYRCKFQMVKAIEYGRRFVHSGEAVEKIEGLLLAERPTLAHLHNIYHQLTPSIIQILKKHGAKVVLTAHDGKLVCPAYLMLDNSKICTACGGQHFWKPVVKRCQNSLTQGFLLMLEAYWHKWKKSYQLVDMYIAPSKFMADLISLRIPRKKIRVLHNGIDVEHFCQDYVDDGYALYFGRISKEKGIETLLRAHEQIDNCLALKVVGTGPMEDKLRREYSKAQFLGYKEGEELNDIIRKSAFVVVPSEWNENCSMVVLEAMAMGKPVIGSRVGGIPEQLEHGKTGFLFEMGNVEALAARMKNLQEDEELRLNMGKAARKKLESEYSLENHCKGLLQIYEEVMGEKLYIPDKK